jgi:acyl dehydratase
MAAVILGPSIGPFADRFDPERVRQFSAAVNLGDLRCREGDEVPPGAAVLLPWSAQDAGRDELVPREFQEAAAGGVHGDHDLVVRRPFVVGEPLSTWVEGWGSRPAGANSVVTLRYVTRDADDHVVVEQWWSTVWLGVTCLAEGAPAPEHAFPDDARDHPIGTWIVDVDEGTAQRYAEVSGDWSAHHFDEEAARRSGAERPFLHGLCTLALCARGVGEVVAGGNTGALQRIAVRFARPLPLGSSLVLRLYRIGPREVAFEAHGGDLTVVSNGRARLA